MIFSLHSMYHKQRRRFQHLSDVMKVTPRSGSRPSAKGGGGGGGESPTTREHLQTGLAYFDVFLFITNLKFSVYSADTRTMNAKALFSLYLYFFITYFITFFRTSQSQTRGDVTAETFFRPFSTEKRVKRCVGQ